MERRLCLCQWDVADGAEESAVVEPVDLFQGFPLDLAHRFPWADLVDDFGLEQADAVFGEGNVVGVTDRKIDLGLGQAFGLSGRQVLRSSVPMMIQALVI
jgi:hypothetical protein